MYRILNKPLFMTTDISSTQSQQEKQHYHITLIQIQGCANKLPCPSQKLYPRRQGIRGMPSPSTPQICRPCSKLALPLKKSVPQVTPKCGRTHTNRQPTSWQGFLLLNQAEIFLPLKGCRTLCKMRKRNQSHKNSVFLIIN